MNRRTNGQVKVDVYPNAQLATQAATIDGLVSGSIDLAVISSSFLVPLYPKWQVFDVPFMFKDMAAAYRVFGGPIGNEYFSELETKGIVGLTWGTAGFKELSTTNRAVVNPEDMKGLRIRIAAGQVFVATYQALSAIPVVLDTSETYTALSQHTVDGMDNAIWVVAEGKFYTVIKHVAMMNLILSVAPLLGSKRKMDAMPANLQKIMREEGYNLTPSFRAYTDKQNNDDAEVLKKNGVQFTQISYPAFRKAVEPVYTMVQAKLGGDILQRVSRAAGA